MIIVLFTDFGLEGPYTGQVKTVLHQIAPGVPLVDLFANLPAAKPQPAAYLLAAYGGWFPPSTVILAVVDPGVGGSVQRSSWKPIPAGMSVRITVCLKSSRGAPTAPGVGRSPKGLKQYRRASTAAICSLP